MWLSGIKKLYETFPDSDGIHDSEEAEDFGLSTSADHAVTSPFNASKGWFEKFQKCFGRKNAFLHGEATFANSTRAQAYVNNKFNVIIEEVEYMSEQVFNMDETG